MNTEPMKKCARIQVPKTYSKVNTTRHKVRLLITWV